MDSKLKKIGLKENETKIYLLILELGKSTIHELSRLSRIKRGTVYNVIESLLEKRFLAIKNEGKKKIYIAESPNNLNFLFESQQHELEEKKKYLDQMLPNLNFLYNSSDVRPKVRYYEGYKGALALREEYLKTKSKKIDNILFYDNSFKRLPEARKYSKERVQKNIKSRFIYISKKGRDLDLEKNDKAELRKSKYIPYDKFSFNIDLSIFDEKVVIKNKKNNNFLAVMISDKDIADSFRIFFDSVWDR